MAETKYKDLNLVQKLTEIRKMSDVVSKDKRGYNYSYADITAILANVTAGMKKYGVSLIPRVVPGTTEVTQNVVTNTKVSKAGNTYDNVTTEMLVKAEMEFVWVNDDDPNETIIVPWVVVGSQSDPSQAFGSALTYCTRYFLTSYFQIAQPESDVDAYRSKQKEAAEFEDKATAEEIINTVDLKIREFLAENPDRTEEMKRFICKYVKNGNYRAIKEPKLAAKLLDDLQKTYFTEGEK